MDLACFLVPELVGYKDFTRQDLKFAVIGFGKMGILHSAILNLLVPHCVEAVVDKSYLLTFGGSRLIKTVRFYRDLMKMVRTENPDAVYVTTPAHSHYPVVSGLLEAGVRYIFVEKPPTTCLNELNLLLNKTRNDQIVMVGFQKRYSLPFRHARMLLSSSVVGDVEEVYGSIKSSDIMAPTGRFDLLGRGVLLDVAVHLIDLLVWLFDIDKVETASCESIHTRVDDCFEARLRTKDDVKVVLEATWSSPGHRLPETSLEVHGSKGVLKVTEDHIGIKLTEDSPLLNDKAQLAMYRPEYYQSVPPINLADPEYVIEDMHFLSSIYSSVQPLTSLRNASHVMKIVDELYRKAGK